MILLLIGDRSADLGCIRRARSAAAVSSTVHLCACVRAHGCSERRNCGTPSGYGVQTPWRPAARAVLRLISRELASSVQQTLSAPCRRVLLRSWRIGVRCLTLLRLRCNLGVLAGYSCRLSSVCRSFFSGFFAEITNPRIFAEGCSSTLRESRLRDFFMHGYYSAGLSFLSPLPSVIRGACHV